MTVAEPEQSVITISRIGMARQLVARLAGPTFFILAIASLIVAAGTGGYLARSTEVDRLDRQLAALTTEVGDNGESVDAASARVVVLSELNLQLASDLDVSEDLAQDLAGRLASVEAAVQSTVDLETSLEALIQERDQLRDDFAEVNSAFTIQSVRMNDLKSIESFGPIDNPLLFDESTNTWVTQPVCTGSMEPAIGCEDLLVVYRPTVTDLDVGDIIIFQRPGLNCQGFVPGSFLLHRITRVVSSATDGLAFETKGDANLSIDPCRAPVSTVTGKVLAVIQNSRLTE